MNPKARGTASRWREVVLPLGSVIAGIETLTVGQVEDDSGDHQTGEAKGNCTGKWSCPQREGSVSKLDQLPCGR